MTTTILLLGSAVAGLLFPVGTPSPWSDPHGGRVFGPACVLTAIDSAFVTGDGRSLYVEAQTVGLVRGGLLIVGQPSYEWIENPGGRLTMTRESSDLGVWLTDGTVSRIPFPPEVDGVEWVRGAAVAPGRWGFVMQEVEGTASGGPRPGAIVYAEYTFPIVPAGAEATADGARAWSRVEAVLSPGDPWDSVLPMSTLQQAPGGGPLAWAGLARTRRGMMDVALFQRTPAGWGASVLVPDWADVADLRVAPAGPWTLAVGGLDPAFGSLLTSIRAFPIVDGRVGDPVRLDMGEAGDRFRRPVVSGVDDPTPDVAWVRVDAVGRRRVWLATDVHTAQRPMPILLDPWGDHVRFAGRVARSNLWLTRRTSTLTGSATLRIVEVTEGVPVELATIPYPFFGDFEVVRDAGGDLLVVGPTAKMSTFTPSVRSLILRLSIDCT
jgi:hypothetical protein